jgi:hypothetical protein
VQDRDATALCERMEASGWSDLDAVQLTIRWPSREGLSLPLRSVRRRLSADGELLVQVRPSCGKEQLDTIARSALGEGFAVRSGAIAPGRGDFLIFSRDDDPREPVARDERLRRRLHLVAQSRGARLPSA